MPAAPPLPWPPVLHSLTHSMSTLQCRTRMPGARPPPIVPIVPCQFQKLPSPPLPRERQSTSSRRRSSDVLTAGMDNQMYSLVIRPALIDHGKDSTVIT